MINKITPELIKQLQTREGGWTKQSLAQLGIGWPPPKGWREFLELKAHISPVYGRGRFPKIVQKGLCRGCGDPVPKGRQTWCSKLCFDRHDPHTVKRRVFERDKGICQICGLDFKKAYNDWLAARPQGLPYSWKDGQAWQRLKPKKEFDHITPFSEGGITVVENMRTLCEACHKERTKRWHADRKAKRMAEKLNSKPL